MALKAKETHVMEPFSMDFGYVTFHLLGATSLIYHAMAAKAWRELLNPRGRLSAADKVANVKHDPLQEYRDSVYQRGGEGPTRLVFPAANFKQAIAHVALRTPGLKKTEIDQLVTVMGKDVDMYGIPQLGMDIVRMADINKTPDVRTRAELQDWTASINVRYVRPNLSAQTVASLVQAAGMIEGIGDWRVGKGSGAHGQWEVVAEDDPRRLAIMEHGDMEVQDRALQSPDMRDETSAELFEWHAEQMAKKDEGSRPRKAA